MIGASFAEVEAMTVARLIYWHRRAFHYYERRDQVIADFAQKRRMLR